MLVEYITGQQGQQNDLIRMIRILMTSPSNLLEAPMPLWPAWVSAVLEPMPHEESSSLRLQVPGSSPPVRDVLNPCL